jgi:peptidoglycan/LPS O-acetylase OafA/YrhL
MNPRAGARIPSLDGLRAISIALVLFAHMCGTRNFPLSVATENFWGLGEFGVTVFFVISGFLITGLLLQEVSHAGRIQLGRFYLRRTLRIFPPYYTLLVALGVAWTLGAVALSGTDLARGATYTSNYYLDRSWFMGHTWSLSVEEQFYLLWPAVLLLAGLRRGFFIAAAVVLLSPFIRVAEWELFRSAGADIGVRFETVADSIATGCLLAGTRTYLHRAPLYRRLLASRAFVAIPAIAVLANLTHDHPLVSFGLGMTAVNVAIALCIDWAVTHDAGRIGRMLNAAPLVFLGWISYSLYLWQQPFLNRASPSVFAAFPLNLVCVVMLALLSYYVVERPALRLRKAIERATPAPRPRQHAAEVPPFAGTRARRLGGDGGVACDDSFPA